MTIKRTTFSRADDAVTNADDRANHERMDMAIISDGSRYIVLPRCHANYIDTIKICTTNTAKRVKRARACNL